MESALKIIGLLLASENLPDLGRALAGGVESVAEGIPALVLTIDERGLTPYPSPKFPSQYMERYKELALRERYLSKVQTVDILEVEARDWNAPLPAETRAVVLAPLSRRGKQFGVMLLLAPRRVPKRERDLIKLLGDVAVLAADGITSASLVQTRLYKSSLLQEVSQGLTASLNIENIGRVASEGAMKLSGADGARIWTLSPRSNPKLLEAAGAVWNGPEPAGDWNWRAYRRALRKRVNDMRSAVVNDARARVDDALAPLLGPFLSWAAFPLVPYDKPIGLLEIFSRRPYCFSPDDQLVLGIFAEALAFALQNAVLYNQIAEQKDQITRMKDYVEGILKDITDGIIVVDSGNTVVIFNPEARRLAGTRNKRVVGADFNTALPKELTAKMTELRSGPFERDAMLEFELSGDGENGGKPRPVGLRYMPLKGPESEGDQLFVLQDLSRLREIETLRELDRLKSQFISAVGHELRTPLTSIQGFISTLRQAADDEFSAETRREFYGIIESECLALTRLIDNLLHVSRIDAGETVILNPRPFDIGKTIERVVRTRKSPSDKHSIQVHISKELGPITADEGLVEHVLANLFTNALKYSPAKSVVTLAAIDEGDAVKVTVLDQGPGIPPEERKNIFRQFYRIQNPQTASKGGAGVGLFLSRYLIRMHGGTIGVEPGPEGGSLFFFTLPKNR